MMLNRVPYALLLLVLVLSVAGCALDSAPTATNPVPRVSRPVAVVSPTEETPPPHIEPTRLEPTLIQATAEILTPAAEPTATPTPPPTSSPTASASPTPIPSPLPTATPAAIAQSPDPSKVRVELQAVVGGLETPVGIASAQDGSARLFLLEKVGRVRLVQGGVLQPEPFLDITDRVGSTSSEQGLLGLAFHPGYAANGFFFVNYTNGEGDTVVSRFSVSGDPARADAGSESVLLTVDQPARNHNGGHLAFGPEGFLYVGLGDGGGAGDQFGHGQNGQTLLGALLRLDVDGGLPYGVPQSNPFVGRPGWREELWAIGLRNPWRFSFDRLTGDLYIADVGQNTYEEIDVQPAGAAGGRNYGWPIMEGSHCFPADRSCDNAGLVLPVWDYDHSQGCSVTGGHVYRGQDFPILRGIYLFGDYCSGRIWGMAPGANAGDGGWRVAQMGQADVRLSSFGEDEQAELYLLDAQVGILYRITASLR